jgi:carbon starvation protein
LVIAAFSIIVAKTFTSVPAAASSSIMFIILAVIFGIGLQKLKLPLGISTVVGVIILLVMLWLGQLYPLEANDLTWLYVLLAYIYVASVAPVWLLLQPRDYLNSFLLYMLLIGGFIGMLFYNPSISFPAFTSIKTESLGYLFPMLFVTVACGAISGFHSLVASGTTSKQLNTESDAQPVAFGGMLIETFLGVLALLTAVTLTPDGFTAELAAKGPVGVFSNGMANAISTIPGLNLEASALIVFVSLIVSAFALTSLDTATRLGRFAFQELAEFMPEKFRKPMKNKHLATILTILPAAALMFSGQWKAIWPLFGSANQLLASIALLSITVWYFYKFKVKPLFIIIPMITMFLVTCFALISLISTNLEKQGYLLALLSAILLVLAIFLAREARKVLHQNISEQNPYQKDNK